MPNPKSDPRDDPRNGPLDGSTSGTIGGGGPLTGGPTNRPEPPERPPTRPENAASGRVAPDPLAAAREDPNDLAPGPTDVSRQEIIGGKTMRTLKVMIAIAAATLW